MLDTCGFVDVAAPASRAASSTTRAAKTHHDVHRLRHAGGGSICALRTACCAETAGCVGTLVFHPMCVQSRWQPGVGAGGWRCLLPSVNALIGWSPPVAGLVVPSTPCRDRFRNASCGRFANYGVAYRVVGNGQSCRSFCHVFPVVGHRPSQQINLSTGQASRQMPGQGK